MKSVRYLKKILILIVVGLLLCAAFVYLTKLRPTVTRDTIEVLSETEKYVMFRHGSKQGRLHKEFEFHFDGEFPSWFGEGRWTTMTLLSPSAKTVKDYDILRKKIFAGETGFADNRIEAFDGVAKFSSVAPAEDMVTSKAMLENNGLWFVQGDHLWFRGRYFLESGVPFTIVDFQERGRYQSPGPRIMISDQNHIGVELKYGTKPKLRQNQVTIPLKQWFELKVHLVLDHRQGEVRVWQDGVLIIDEMMKTLPAKNSLLNALEVGITAASEPAVLLVDDVFISHKPF